MRPLGARSAAAAPPSVCGQQGQTGPRRRRARAAVGRRYFTPQAAGMQ